MPLFIIGLGLGDERDITLKGLEIVKSCDKIYLESYTSILGVKKQSLEALYQKEIIEADRDLCETQIDNILEDLSK
jgi:diphthine synthase